MGKQSPRMGSREISDGEPVTVTGKDKDPAPNPDNQATKTDTTDKATHAGEGNKKNPSNEEKKDKDLPSQPTEGDYPSTEKDEHSRQTKQCLDLSLPEDLRRFNERVRTKFGEMSSEDLAILERNKKHVPADVQETLEKSVAKKCAPVEFFRFALRDGAFSSERRDFSRMLYDHEDELVAVMVRHDLTRLRRVPNINAYTAKSLFITNSSSLVVIS